MGEREEVGEREREEEEGRKKQMVEEDGNGWRLKRHLYHRGLEKNSKVMKEAKGDLG